MRLIYPGPWWIEGEINSCSKVSWSWPDDTSTHNSISACWQLNTGIPAFRKFALHHLAFRKRPTLVPDFSNQKKSEEDFCFCEKRWKVKTVFSVCFQEAVTDAVCAQSSSKRGTTKLLWNYTQCLSIKLPELWTVCEHLGFISIHLVHLLARCVLR